jgi:hypothetical protein
MADIMSQPKLRIFPMTIAKANTLVAHWHRHHRPLEAAKFCIGICDEIDNRVCGAAIVGRPVARILDDGMTLEVNRCVTDGTPNACSALYGAAARSAKALGYLRIFTYTRIDEPGTSLRAAGWVLDDPTIRARSWNMPGRKRIDRTEIIGRQRWIWTSGLSPLEPKFPALTSHTTGTRDMFAEPS